MEAGANPACVTEGDNVSDLIDTTEMYLKTIYELAEEGIIPLRARIAERLGHSGPTVSQTVARMERDGLVVVTGDRHLELTPEGFSTAMRVMRKHRLTERLLTDVIGLDWAHVHEEACRWEHVVSDLVERRLVELLDHPEYDPYGNPIPGLEELGEEPAREEFLTGVISAPEYLDKHAASSSDAAGVTLRRIGEPLQSDIELLQRFLEAGVKPGEQVLLTAGVEVISVRGVGADTVLDLPLEFAKHLFVDAK